MTNQLVKYHESVPAEWYTWAPLAVDWKRDQRSTYVRSVIAPAATDQEWAGFVEVANRFRLNPLQNPRPIWLIRYDEGGPMQPQIGIAGYRIFAERSGRYAGSTPPEWAGKPRNDEAPIVWRTAWLYDDPPAVARAGAWATGFREPVWGIATFREFAKYTFDRKTNQRRLRSLWATYPSLMLGKNAEKQALCKAFPEQLAEPEALQLFSEGDAPRVRVQDTGAAWEPRVSVPGVELPRLEAQRPKVADLYPDNEPEPEPPAQLRHNSGTTPAAPPLERQTGNQGDPSPFWSRVRELDFEPAQSVAQPVFGVPTMLAWMHANPGKSWADALELLNATAGAPPKSDEDAIDAAVEQGDADEGRVPVGQGALLDVPPHGDPVDARRRR